MSTMTETERREALALLQTTNQQMADRAACPVWYNPTLGLLAGGMSVTNYFPPPYSLFYIPVFAIGLILLVRGYRKRTGMWINGYRAGRTRWVAVGIATLAMLTIWTVTYLRWKLNMLAAPFVGGVLIAVATTYAGVLWQRAYRRDLGVGQV